MFGTKPEIAGWAGWHPSVDGPAERRANSVTVRVRGGWEIEAKITLAQAEEEKGDKVCQEILLLTNSYLKNDGSFFCC